MKSLSDPKGFSGSRSGAGVDLETVVADLDVEPPLAPPELLGTVDLAADPDDPNGWTPGDVDSARPDTDPGNPEL
ncbi:hypothetical protein PI124_g21980 [Phytophthora idaei]|nr:hypothetical protein PI125_g783 [Phytophthora idaei]KAG3146837.1 hypothetical protein PI126_g13137 [Phytophthora idaei]KAG3232943.1 hypothetical protein PI124_g21980 [Phytophthora idaei]